MIDNKTGCDMYKKNLKTICQCFQWWVRYSGVGNQADKNNHRVAFFYSVISAPFLVSAMLISSLLSRFVSLPIASLLSFVLLFSCPSRLPSALILFPSLLFSSLPIPFIYYRLTRAYFPLFLLGRSRDRSILFSSPHPLLSHILFLISPRLFYPLIFSSLPVPPLLFHYILVFSFPLSFSYRLLSVAFSSSRLFSFEADAYAGVGAAAEAEAEGCRRARGRSNGNGRGNGRARARGIGRGRGNGRELQRDPTTDR